MVAVADKVESLLTEHFDAWDVDWKRAFLGLFYGARSPAIIYDGFIRIGKSECEISDWHKFFSTLRTLKLIDFELTTEKGTCDSTDRVVWGATDRGFALREAYWNRLNLLNSDSSE